jgi:hypothetical protein
MDENPANNPANNSVNDSGGSKAEAVLLMKELPAMQINFL